MRKILVGLLFIDFVALSLATLVLSGTSGLSAFIEGGNLWSLTLAVDLVIALGFICFWMWHDARERGVNATPYIVLTCLTGSVGPLLYVLRRPETFASEPRRLSPPATA